MSDAGTKHRLQTTLDTARTAVVASLDGLSPYDARRPLTPTGTNLLGLVKHLAIWESRYLGHVFDRPFTEPLPAWDDWDALGTDLWVRADEARDDILGLSQRVTAHAGATIEALTLDAPGHVPWWPEPEVTLFSVLVHRIAETNRHAGHADILREQLDRDAGAPPTDAYGRDADFWAAHCAVIERDARLAAERRA